MAWLTHRQTTKIDQLQTIQQLSTRSVDNSVQKTSHAPQTIDLDKLLKK